MNPTRKRLNQKMIRGGTKKKGKKDKKKGPPVEDLPVAILSKKDNTQEAPLKRVRPNGMFNHPSHPPHPPSRPDEWDGNFNNFTEGTVNNAGTGYTEGSGYNAGAGGGHYTQDEPDWDSFKRIVESFGNSKEAADYLASCYRYYLILSKSGNEDHQRFARLIRGYIAEFCTGEQLQEMEYTTSSAVLKNFGSHEGASGKFRYLTEPLRMIWEACFIHLPRQGREPVGDPLLLFKAMVSEFVNQTIELDEFFSEMPRFMAKSLELMRGVRNKNADYIRGLAIGQKIDFSTFTSTSFSKESARKFTTPDNGVICVFRFGSAKKPENGQEEEVVPGIVISGSFVSGEISENEVLMRPGLSALLVDIKPDDSKATLYTFDVIGSYKSIDANTIRQNIARMDGDSISRMAAYTPPDNSTMSEEEKLSESTDFIDNHFPPGSDFRALIGMSEDELRIRAFGSLTRSYTFHPNAINTERFAPAASNGGARMDGPPGIPSKLIPIIEAGFITPYQLLKMERKENVLFRALMALDEDVIRGRMSGYTMDQLKIQLETPIEQTQPYANI